MSENNKSQQRLGPAVGIILLALVAFALLLTFLLQGTNVALINPKGLIAHEQQSLMKFTVTILLIIAIPTLLLLFYIAWRYRETHPKTKNVPSAHRSKFLVPLMWLTPTAVMIVLATAMWPATHRLAPQKLIAADAKPMTIQVISLRWKWVFIYPEQQVATVNFVQIPVNTPVTFEMTADETPMSSFWIPNLGGQLYTMTSHVNRLNLMADTPGDYPGSTAEINGIGFAGMKFTARVSSAEDFNEWVRAVKKSPDELNAVTYANLLKPSEYDPSVYYSSFDPSLYASVIRKYEGPEGHSH